MRREEYAEYAQELYGRESAEYNEHEKVTRHIVCAKDPKEYEEKFNEEIGKLLGTKCRVIDVPLGDSFCTIIESIKEIPATERMTIKDEFHLNGIRYTCSQCPYMEPPKDRRYKTCICPYSTYGTTRKDSECCDLFYTKLVNHEVEPKTY